LHALLLTDPGADVGGGSLSTNNGDCSLFSLVAIEFSFDRGGDDDDNNDDELSSLAGESLFLITNESIRYVGLSKSIRNFCLRS